MSVWTVGQMLPPGFDQYKLMHSRKGLKVMYATEKIIGTLPVTTQKRF